MHSLHKTINVSPGIKDTNQNVDQIIILFAANFQTLKNKNR